MRLEPAFSSPAAIATSVTERIEGRKCRGWLDACSRHFLLPAQHRGSMVCLLPVLGQGFR